MFHKENGGLSDARNFGLKKASGDYIFFVDGDDFLSGPNVLAHLYQYSLNFSPDLILFNMQKYYEKTGMISKSFVDYDIYKQKDPIDTLYYLVKDNNITVSACSFLIRRRFLVDHHLFFKKDIKSEDIKWAFCLFSSLPSWGSLNENIYVYRKQRSGSITSNINAEHIETYASIIENSIAMCENIENDRLRFILMSYAMYIFLIYCGLYRTVLLPKNDRKVARNRGMKIAGKYLKIYTLNRSVHIASLVYRIFGYHAMEELIYLFLIIRKLFRKLAGILM